MLRVLRDQPQSLALATAADGDRRMWSLDGLGFAACLLQGEVLALVIGHRVAEQPHDHFHTFRELFEADGVFSERLDRVATAYADLPEIMEIVAFIRADARRPLCLPGE